MNKLRLTGSLLTRLLGLLLVYVSCVQVGYAQQSGGGNYPTGNGVRVKEVDGSPNVPGTQTLVFPNGSLTRAGQTVTVTIAGGTTINSTNGQVPYRSNSTTFADSGIAYSSGMIGIQITPTAAQLEINSQSTTRPSLKLRALAATGINQATFENYDASGTRTAYIQADGSYVTTGNMSATNLTATYYNFASNRGYIQASSNGVFTLLDTAGTSFGRLQIGGSSSGYPSLKRSSAELQIRLADDSGFAAEQSLYLRYGSGTPEGAVTAPVGAIYSRTDGGAGTSFYVKESGTGNTGWVAK